MLIKLKIVVVICVCFVVQNVLGQCFEGRITYRLSCKSKVKDYPDEQMCAGLPKRLDYFIKNGNYKFVSSDSSDKQWMLYVNKDNKIYNKMPGNDTIYWKFGTDISDSILEVKINKNVTKVLGLLCNEIIFVCTDMVHKFYYNQQISVDKKMFSHHKYGGLYDFSKDQTRLF